jgi:2-dehydro-3-deoxyglucarate aldolase
MNKKIKIQQIRNRLNSNNPSIGSWMQIPNSSVAEIMGNSGYDWVTIDMEHGSFNHSQLPDLFRALELNDTLPLVRVSEASARECRLALDAGSGGIIIPMIESADQLLHIQDNCKWPPSGKRGVGFCRANMFGKHFDSYKEEAQSPLLIPMIESIRAVENIDSILNVDGLDAILIGPYDLSASMNMTGDFENSDFKHIINKILEKANNYNIAAGIHIVQPSKVELDKRIEEGYKFIAYSIDTVFLNTISNFKNYA